MADFYCDEGVYGATNRLGLDAPAWGVPQEGDGSAVSAAAAAAVAEIRIIASPTAAETIVIAGAVITAGASAAANTFVRGATPADTATNIVALINSSNATNVVGSSVARSVGNNSNQLRNMCYARVKPGATDTVQIMFRVGSAALNHANNSNVAISSAGWASAPTVTQFAGGSGGCFGWLYNPSAIGQGSSIAADAYGLIFCAAHVQKSPVSAGISSYVRTVYDRVICRNNKSIGFTATASRMIYRTAAALAEPTILVADDGTTWIGDSPTNKITFTGTYNASSFTSHIALHGRPTAPLVMEARQPDGWNFGVAGTASFGNPQYEFSDGSSSGSVSQFRNVRWFDACPSYGGSTVGRIFNMAGALYASNVTNVLMDNCKFAKEVAFSSVDTNCIVALGNSSLSGEFHVRLINPIFELNYTGVSTPAYGLFHFNGTSASCSIEVIGGEVRKYGGGDFPFGNWPLFTGTGYGPRLRGLIHNMKGVALPSAYAGFQGYNGSQNGSLQDRSISVFLADENRTTRYEDYAGVCDWVPGAGYPTLTAVLPNDTPYSMRLVWVANSGQMCGRGFCSNRIVYQYRATSAVCALGLEFFMNTSLVLSPHDFVVTFQYIDSNGIPRTEVKTGADVVASAAAWNNTGSYLSHGARKISFNSAYPVKQKTEIIAQIHVRGAPSTGNAESIFYNPIPLVS